MNGDLITKVEERIGKWPVLITIRLGILYGVTWLLSGLSQEFSSIINTWKFLLNDPATWGFMPVTQIVLLAVLVLVSVGQIIWQYRSYRDAKEQKKRIGNLEERLENAHQGRKKQNKVMEEKLKNFKRRIVHLKALVHMLMRRR